jgi:streptomycin 6-kinase
MNLAANGEAGRAWLSALPELVEELAVTWSLSIGPPFIGGAVGFVAPGERPDGERFVLKVSFVDDETRHECDALVLWDGDGAVRLVDADPERGALLLERLEPGRPLGDHPDRDEAISIACRLLMRLWRRVPDPHPFPSVRDLALRLADELPERFGRHLQHPFDEALVRVAVDACIELSRSAEEPVLANRDYHLWNVLSAAREPWLAIDPKPLVGERAFDTGHFVRSLLPDELDPAAVDGTVTRLASELGLEPKRVRAWAFVRSVDDALWGLSIGGTDVEWDVRCARLLALGL